MTARTQRLPDTGAVERVASERLRRAAANRAPTSLGDDTLALLHRMASNPDQAFDALHLLHELQVHQVELQQQYEEMQTGLAEAVAAGQRQAAHFDAAPVALLVLDADSRVVRANRCAAELLGVAPTSLIGRLLLELLPAASRPGLHELLQCARSEGAQARAEAVVDTRASAGRPSQRLRLSASACPQLAGGPATVLLAAVRAD